MRKRIDFGGKSRLRGQMGLVSAAVALILPPICLAAPAGISIDNVAQVRFTADAKDIVLSSNTVTLRLGEVINVRVEALTPTLAVEPGDARQKLAFRVTNTGNGREAFMLDAVDMAGDAFDPTDPQIIIDRDGDGRLNPAIDVAYGSAADAPDLAAGDSVVVFVTADIPQIDAVGARGGVMLTAHAAAGRGAAGSVVAGRGDDGVEAVFGDSAGQAAASAMFVVGPAQIELVKTQSVTDIIGRSTATAGAVVTYRLEARFPGANTVREAVISDPIPAGSAYVAGSLRLDQAVLTDAADQDGGQFIDGAIHVALGDIAGPTRRVVTFQVRINPLGK